MALSGSAYPALSFLSLFYIHITMAKDPAFLFYPGDYLRDTQCLCEQSQVAYDRIMCEHMRNICISKEQFKFFTKKLTPEQTEELLFILTETKNGYQIDWVVESINKRRAFSESRRNNRTGKVKKHMKTYVKHMEIEIEIKDEYKDIIKEWFDYKKERKESYKSKKSQQAFYNSLIEMSDNNPDTAKKIITQSMANNWAGIFELKKNKKPELKPTLEKIKYD